MQRLRPDFSHLSSYIAITNSPFLISSFYPQNSLPPYSMSLYHLSVSFPHSFVSLFLCIAEPDWASLTLGVYVCQACSLLHRSIPHISRVKSIQDTWDASEVEVRRSTSIYIYRKNGFQWSWMPNYISLKQSSLWCVALIILVIWSCFQPCLNSITVDWPIIILTHKTVCMSSSMKPDTNCARIVCKLQYVKLKQMIWLWIQETKKYGAHGNHKV